MVLPQPKPPSQLWQEASPESRAFLERIVIAVHRAWQESDHYSPKTAIERLPNATTIWDDRIGSGRFELTWQNQGAGEQIAVRIGANLDGVFYLLGNEAQIHLLTNWLFLGSEQGFPAAMPDADMDRMDVRRHLAFLGDAPSALMWATVNLYECCIFARPDYVALGLDGWGFWSADHVFVPFLDGNSVPTAFADFDALMLAHPGGDVFRRICSSEDVSFDLRGLASYSERNSAGFEIVSDGLRFGSLLAYLHEQEPESIDLLIGQIYAGVRRAAALDYELPPEFVSRPEYTAELPIHYNSHDMARDLILTGQRVERLNWRLREERRVLLARRFDNAGRPRSKAATQARQTDAQKRQRIIETYLKTADLEPHRARSTGRLVLRSLAREIEAKSIFDGHVKSPIGDRQIAKILKRILKK